MPPTEEIKCTNDACFLDMFENHYTYDVPDDHTVSDMICPVCGDDGASRAHRALVSHHLQSEEHQAPAL
ncbi:MAG: hypothetical protein U5K37_02405 [Natrialbaceae archaeon]|nr:hypothetical protein [Natrialbaceae archaeon]